jgi:hypothetical protein
VLLLRGEAHSVFNRGLIQSISVRAWGAAFDCA